MRNTPHRSQLPLGAGPQAPAPQTESFALHAEMRQALTASSLSEAARIHLKRRSTSAAGEIQRRPWPSRRRPEAVDQALVEAHTELRPWEWWRQQACCRARSKAQFLAASARDGEPGDAHGERPRPTMVRQPGATAGRQRARSFCMILLRGEGYVSVYMPLLMPCRAERGHAQRRRLRRGAAVSVNES